MITMKQIKSFCERIVTSFKPHRVILFGSYAVGKSTPDSDVDILVIMPFDGKPVEKSVEIRLKAKPEFPLDLLVRTPEHIRNRLSMGDFFVQEILEKGKVLYETADI